MDAGADGEAGDDGGLGLGEGLQARVPGGVGGGGELEEGVAVADLGAATPPSSSAAMKSKPPGALSIPSAKAGKASR